MTKGINKEKENKIHKAVTLTDKKNLRFLSHNETSDRTSAEGSQLLGIRGNMSIIFQFKMY